MPDVHGKDNMDEATTHTNQMGEIVRTTHKSVTGLVVPSVHKSQVSDPAESDDYELARYAGVEESVEVPEEEIADLNDERLSDLNRSVPDEEEEVDATPAAAALAEEHDVDLADVPHEGEKVTKPDVAAHLSDEEVE